MREALAWLLPAKVRAMQILIPTLGAALLLIPRPASSAPLTSPASGALPTTQPGLEIFLPFISAPLKGPIWISPAEIAALPRSGPAWNNLKDSANGPLGQPDLSDQNSDTDVLVLANALVYRRTGDTTYRRRVVNALRVITLENTEAGGRTLALGRNLVGYIIAADLIDLAVVDAELNQQFRAKLRQLLDKDLGGLNLRSTHELRPNNWGGHAGASRAAAAIYLGDKKELERTAQVFKGWLGDRDAYAGFEWGKDLSWQCDPQRPVGIDPAGCQKQGHPIGGAQPDEMRRGGSFQWPPAKTGYGWEGLQGAIVQAQILSRAGYDAWSWEDQALLRAVQFLYDQGWPATADDTWQIWLINSAYGTAFPAQTPAGTGKNMGWTDWTHGGR